MRTGLAVLVTLVAAATVPALTAPLLAAELLSIVPKELVDATKYDPHEPLASTLSVAKSAASLDEIAAFWMESKESPRGDSRRYFTSCGGCHANFAYLMARPLLLAQFPTSGVDKTRHWMDQRSDDAISGKLRNAESQAVTARFSPLEFVTIAAGLAFHDAQAGDRLQPMTRKALKRMWASQTSAGDWEPLLMCASMSFPVAEFDPYYGATLAALATGIAPESYAQSDEAKAGLTRLRRFFQANKAPNMHHQAMLLWASLRVDGLMTPTERAATVKSLLALQRADGGWSTLTFRIKPRHNQQRFPDSSSDGYGTGFVVYILRQAGLPANQPEVVRGVNWLKSHQRVSGRWHTAHWLGDDQTEGGIGTRGLSIVNLGTAFSVMALHACKETDRTGLQPIPLTLATETGKIP